VELLQLRYFCHAAETENFSKTAKEYTVPTSNISQSIHRLEDELGASLFDRRANKVNLNDYGKEFYENVKTALVLIDEAKNKLSSNDELFGEIRILANANRQIVTRAIEEFPDSLNKVSFFINTSSDEEIDKYDLIITDKLIPQRHFKKKPLIVDDILLAMRKDNPLASKDDLSVKDLENERFITMSKERGIFALTNEICNSAGFIPNVVIQSDDPYYIRKYVEMGLGICFYPSRSWGGMFAENVECMRLVDVKRYTYVYYNEQKHMSKAKKMFLDSLIRISKEYIK